MEISLYLTKSGSDISLISTLVTGSPIHGPIRSTRSYSLGHSGWGTFGWTRAVKALVLLLIKYELRRRSLHIADQDTAVMLAGGANSPASSLDLALSKKTRWLCDMFGVTATGEPLARRLLLRTNPERKRPGPVRVSVNPAYVAGVRVYIDHQQVTQHAALQDLSKILSASWETEPKRAGSSDAGVTAA